MDLVARVQPDAPASVCPQAVIIKPESHMNDMSLNGIRTTIAVPGRNAWRRETADALSVLVDGAAYFDALDRTLRLARRSIRIVGWDFNPDIKLRPCDSEETLGELLLKLVEEKPDLQVHILVWAMGPIYSSHSLKLFQENGWSSHPRIHLCFDTRHPLRGSHHQKIVTLDDATAFVGGIDLTGGRWDTPAHAAGSPDRVKPDGQLYGPVHDVQAMVSGGAARALADLVRWRWKKATGEELTAVNVQTAPWPPEIAAQMEFCNVAIARALPSIAGIMGRREALRLTRDAIAAARERIYIETQYLASFSICRALTRRLRQPDGPEVAIVVTSSSRGMLEQFVMARNRNRLIRRLRKADHHDRLRVMYAVVPAGEKKEQEVLVHAKVVVIDDTFLRIGSSNLNNRSEGLDTECDIGIEASNAIHRQAIAGVRHRLLAEHLDADPDRLADLESAGSMVKAIDTLNVRPRGLRPFDVDPDGRTEVLPGTALLDPKRPFRPFHEMRRRIASLFL